MKRKRRRKSPKSAGNTGKILLFLVLIGIGLALVYFLRQDILHSFRSLKEKQRPVPVAQKKEVLLYFSDPDGEYLIGEKRKILKKEEVREEAEEALAELIKGPRGELIPTVPPHTKLLTLELDDKGMARVNFNKSLSKDHPGGSSAEMMTAYSIVNSLCFNFPQIKRVQFFIEGKAIETISGHLSLKRPLASKPDLIKK